MGTGQCLKHVALKIETVQDVPLLSGCTKAVPCARLPGSPRPCHASLGAVQTVQTVCPSPCQEFDGLSL